MITSVTKLVAVASLIWAMVPVSARADPASDLIARGEYVTRAADCAACHTAQGGAAFAGGRAFNLPFGVLYSANITPDANVGIAGYTDDEWVRMLHDGVGRGGKHLYPAMPYPSYSQISRNDALSMKAYLMSLKPVNTVPPNNQISFPFNVRFGMIFWNLINNPGKPYQRDFAKSDIYNRGGYLVEALGHCGECHTPRNFMMGLKQSQKLAGAEQVGWLAYNLTNDSASGLANWSDTELAQYLSTGQADGHGPASGPMAEVIQNSLRYLTADDISAMVTYLRNVPAKPGGPPAFLANAVIPPVDALGARLFAQACSGCHLPNGTGRQSAWAALKGAHTAADPAGQNLVQILSEGTQIETSEGAMFMHPFTGAYTDTELAALSNYTIAQFGLRLGHVTPGQFKKLRPPEPVKTEKPAT